MTSDSGLMDFQQATVEYVLRRLYDDAEPTSRFLVADEVGMGKTLVARGVIKGAIERLERDPSVDRIDIVYICSNADIARQNISKLDVVGDGTRPLSTRISMLATQIRDLNRASVDDRKVVNLIAFTPGTSFSRGHATGRVAERALLAYLTAPFIDSGVAARNGLRKVLKGTDADVSRARWDREVDWLANPENAPDEGIVTAFRSSLEASPLQSRLIELVAAATGQELPPTLRKERSALIADLRHLLARVSVAALEPDLIILDEFQRFKHLLDHPDEGNEQEVSQLAHDLFTFENVRVLLLSATPYKPFTLAEEELLTGDNHYKDLYGTIGFLAHPHGEQVVAEVRQSLSTYRDRLIGGGDALDAKRRIEAQLIRVMSRTERPTLGESQLLEERMGGVGSPQSAELTDYVALRTLSRLVDAPLSMDYWKSAPYFLNFMDGYQLSTKVRAQLDDPEVGAALRTAHALHRADVESGAAITPRNSRLRALGADTIGSDSWKLLWLPPSMPYYSPGGAFRNAEPSTVTKRLIFSSWAAAPSAIAALLSHAAHGKMNPRQLDPTPRLTYDTSSGRPEGMTTLALTVPVPALAALADPLDAARVSPERTLDGNDLVKQTARSLHHLLGSPPPPAQGPQPATWFWLAPLRLIEYDATELHSAMTTGRGSDGLRQHLQRANDAAADQIAVTVHPQDLARWFALVGLAGPGNCAWRTLRRLTSGIPGITDSGILQAAARIGDAFRTLFNRAEVIALLDATATDEPYWQRVLKYCFEGNLQAVLDEYLHGLLLNERPHDDHELLEVAATAAAAISFGRGRVQAFDPTQPDHPINFSPRFAIRYGNARGTTKGDAESTERLADVRSAFNSPFWPMVLASTSVGQEGVDFHWWCHSLVHWNQPANVVDLEQREGRVHRFRGHAVRKNVAARHRADALRSADPDPWSAAFAAAARTRPDHMNELWPSWVYPGDAKVQCWTPYFPLSREIERAERLRRDRALYRLAFGQPRQEDLLDLLEQQGVTRDEQRLHDLRIDLRPR